MFDTIVALATPQIKSALGIIRLSGENCFTIVNNFFNREIKFKDKNKIFYGYIVDKEKEETIDEVILLAYKNPYSFTGEDSVEIICHGSPLIFEKIIELSIKFGARLAKGGEYSFRSYVNGKIDLIQAESINDLINAEYIETPVDNSLTIHLLSNNGFKWPVLKKNYLKYIYLVVFGVSCSSKCLVSAMAIAATKSLSSLDSCGINELILFSK